MSDGLYTAMSGGMGTSKKLDITSHNLANIDTTSYKKDKTIFKSQVPKVEFDLLDVQAEDVEMPAKVFHIDKHNVVVDETFTDFSQGSFKKTDNPFDIAIQGDGFFKIETPQGVRYTRNGTFAVSNDNKLVTVDGYKVLDENNNEITISGTNFKVNDSGTIFANDTEVAKLAVIEIDSKQIEKTEKTFYKSINQNIQENKAQNASLHQGFLETSNVNPIEEMVNLISLHRTFELNTRLIETYGELNRKSAGDVGRIG